MMVKIFITLLLITSLCQAKNRFIRFIQLNNLGDILNDDVDIVKLDVSSTNTYQAVVCQQLQFQINSIHEFSHLVVPIEDQQNWIFTRLTIDSRWLFGHSSGSYGEFTINSTNIDGFYGIQFFATSFEKDVGIIIRFGQMVEGEVKFYGQQRQAGYRLIFQLYTVEQNCMKSLRQYRPYQISFDKSECINTQTLLKNQGLFWILLLAIVLIEL